jgi:peptidoglycan/xylan/chitin deacetylase (PgdA/CDA1 family)
MTATLKSLAKTMRDSALAHLVRYSARPPRGSLTILTYHRVIASEDPVLLRVEPGVLMDPETFDMHLAVVKKHFTPIALREWLALRQRGTRSRDRYAAITFDDGWLDNYENAFEVLVAHSMPATIFLVVRAIDQKIRFWTDVVADLYFDGRLRNHLAGCLPERLSSRHGMNRLFAQKATAESLSTLIAVLKELPDSTLHDVLSETASRHLEVAERLGADAPREFMNWREVAEMSKSGVVDFGSHSLSHARLDGIVDVDKLRREIVDSRDELRGRLGDAFNSIFCYPNGSVGAAAGRIVREHYLAACTTVQGFNALATDEFSLRRINMHRDMSSTPSAFLARMA